MLITRWKKRLKKNNFTFIKTYPDIIHTNPHIVKQQQTERRIQNITLISLSTYPQA